MGRRKVDFPLLFTGDELHDRAVDALSRYTVEELRTKARSVVGPGAWTGPKRKLVATLADHVGTAERLKRWEREAPEFELTERERRRRLLAEVFVCENPEELRALRERIAEELDQ